MKEFWNERYSDKTYAYGEEPNQYFKSELDQLEPGKILLPADGEGRNSVYASVNDWEVDACDMSEMAKTKALRLADKYKVDISYRVGDFGILDYASNYFDAIGLIFAHFPPNMKSEYHQMIDSYLKPNGYIIFEAFSKNHLNYNLRNPKVGGPKNLEMLFSIEEIKQDFKHYDFLYLAEEEVTLTEGAYHIGKASVVRFVGKKK